MYNPFVGVAPYSMSCNWACHINGGLHGGVDYATGASSGYPVLAAATGTVVGAALDSAGNSVLTVQGTDGILSVYMHMRQFTVNIGQAVSQGQQLGLSGGKSGDWGKGQATGPHCHWHLIVGSTRTDPIAYLAGTPATPNPTQKDNEMAQVVFSPGYNAYILYAPGYVRIEPNGNAINQYFLYSGQPSVNVNNVPTCPDQNLNLFLLDAAGIPTTTFNTMVAGKTWTAAGGVY